ncbi:response regulator transcription factor [Niabella hibiscisoli]|uniref:response regulator transcription factor n=1 Tax=Niabella hibiscisoli TaxID=1825928 RepID=UPI001F0E0A82|nr:response regulator transcription factor [Niabella hibiscisoli]MCH5717793.1 response regulator transcription factor [Niabella hibiscisoli]
MQTKTIIAIADDHDLFREGIKLVLDNTADFHLAYEVSNGRELISLLDELAGTSSFPGIVLLDINMPELNGYETMQLLGQRYPETPVLVLTMHTVDYSVLSMLRLGARGFLPKSSKKETFLEALANLMAGDYHIPRELSKLFITSQGRQVAGLTAREIEFLGYCHQDISYKEIAEKMICSERTVHSYRDKLLLKLNRKSRNGLTAYAYDIGIITG